MTTTLAATPSPLLDLRATTNHPLSLRYSEVFSQALLHGQFAHARAHPSLSLAQATPFVDAARRALAHGLDRPGVLDVMATRLSAYYQAVRVDNAAQWLDISPASRLAAEPPWAAVLPWRARTVASYRQAHEDAAWAENRSVGRNLGIADGWLVCGPVSDEKIRVEAERMLRVVRDIKANGYRRSDEPDGDVRVTALVDEAHSWRWLITAGNHRAAAAAALGYEAIPIRANLVISRADAPYWKHVVEGLFSLDEALAVFDTIFHGRPSRATQGWAASVRP